MVDWAKKDILLQFWNKNCGFKLTYYLICGMTRFGQILQNTTRVGQCSVPMISNSWTLSHFEKLERFASSQEKKISLKFICKKSNTNKLAFGKYWDKYWFFVLDISSLYSAENFLSLEEGRNSLFGNMLHNCESQGRLCSHNEWGGLII